ncbi:hypothetical protein PPERSA_01928 [Pseudocohnilembus persalinus]|uniref:EamA domain-containing protein n=1 Tax=Pseudocohnilembus persalinus TaxID=266149 RepID=A0A0V0R3H4_PSEPJ|nr:hypothetical protein PPERSA_01928 [Pseudocohnilembus persalinus]|eukprot:KRX09041.1 hypothetical protein PPERSA_01928 [Pseudocohnilembus persalinus]
MSELKNKLLDQNKTPQPHDSFNIQNKQQEESQQQQQQQQEEETIQEEYFEPSPFVIKLKEKYDYFEMKMRDSAGIALFFISLFIISAMNFVSNIIMPENTIIEIAFVAFLVSFLLNYYIIRIGNILPYIENEDKNFSAKLIGFSALLSIILLLFSFQNAEVNSCIFIFILTWVVSYFAEKIYYGTQASGKDLGFILLFTVSGYLLLQPNFIIDYKGSEEDATLSAEQIVEKAEDFVDEQQIGLVAALLSALCFSYMFFNISKLKEKDFITLTHIVCLIVILFLPVFFPIEGLNSPNLLQWGVMIGFGFVFMFVLQMIIRSAQIESPSKLLGTIPIYLAMNVVFGIFLGNFPNLFQILGIAGSVVCGLFMLRNNYLSNTKFLNGVITNYNNQAMQQTSGIKGQLIELQDIHNQN